MKLKTIKSVSKRFKLTKKGKIRHKKAGQDHFNSAERSKTTRSKRKDSGLTPTDSINIKRMMPYN